MGKFFGKIKAFWQKVKPSKRRLIQLYAALLTNANIKGYISGRIYSGATKYACVPGLNCYSCPGAVGACPLGALQNALAASGTRAPYYVLGIVVLFGIILGRTICGFLCPFGLGQDLLYKIKTPKLKKSRYTRILSYFKYVLLAVFVVALPLIYSSLGSPVPAFCKYICPSGTFGGALGLLINPSNTSMFEMLGALFTWKFALMVVILVACVFIYRGFCRFLCPLGAIYGFFNKIALLGVKLDKNKCTDCGLCLDKCKMDVKRVGDHECINCGECMSACPAKAISWKGSKLVLHKNAVEAAPEEEKPQTAKRGKSFWLKVTAWTVAIAVLVGALVYYNFIAKEETPKSVYGVGDALPDFELPTYLRGEDTYSVAEKRGKVLVINFWATWCTPCIAEVPHFERLGNEYDIEVLLVHSTLITEDVAKFILTDTETHAWADYTGVTFAQDTAEANAYYTLGGNDNYPMTIIVDADGTIVHQRIGSVNYEYLETQIKAILEN